MPGVQSSHPEERWLRPQTCRRCNPPTHFCWLCGYQFLSGVTVHTTRKDNYRCAFMARWRGFSLPLRIALSLAILLVVPPLICLAAAVISIWVSNLLMCYTLRLIYVFFFLKHVEWRQKWIPPDWMMDAADVPPVLLSGLLVVALGHLLIGPVCVAFLLVSNEGPAGVQRKLLAAAMMIPFFNSWASCTETSRILGPAEGRNDIEPVNRTLVLLWIAMGAPCFSIVFGVFDRNAYSRRQDMLRVHTEQAVWLAYHLRIVSTLDP
mmetsp:Transcript_36798/g.79600  ORF Transcript_36798/g.79600 Transcript_36798/m.79600 type:complete len:264 (+) Transcript_36798:743-1534(+)